MTDLAIVWFRRDFRLADNPALDHARNHHERVLPVYLHDPEALGDWAPGAASRWWLHHALEDLADRLSDRGTQLVLRAGPAGEQLEQLIEETGAAAVYWNRLYEPELVERDKRIKASLKDAGLEVESFRAAMLFEPWELLHGDDEYYKVFTPYWRAASQQYACPSPAPSPTRFTRFTVASDALDDWTLHPNTPDWSTGFAACWAPGERSAKQRLNSFLDTGINGYVENRDIPSLERGTSGLSPHLAFGEISPAQIWRAIQLRVDSSAMLSSSSLVTSM